MGENDNKIPYSLKCHKKTNDDVIVYRLDDQSKKWIEKRKNKNLTISLNRTPMVFQRYSHSKVKPGTHTPYCRITFSMILWFLVVFKVQNVSLCVIFKWSTILLFVVSRNFKTGRRSPWPSPGQWKKKIRLRFDSIVRCTQIIFIVWLKRHKKMMIINITNNILEISAVFPICVRRAFRIFFVKVNRFIGT
jgi:hypothetical protein